MTEVKKEVKKEVKQEVKKEVKKIKKVKKEIKVKSNPFELNSNNMKSFGVWETKNIEVIDRGLKRYINLNPIYVPTTLGREVKKQFWKSKKPILERLMIRLFVTGHSGKKHKRSSGIFTGKKNITYNTVFNTLKYIEEKTKKNPVEVLVRAIEAGAPREGITTIEYGGVRYPKSVDLSPQRRIDLVLRWLTQGAYQKMSGTKGRKRIYQTLGDQIIATSTFDQTSLAFSKKFDLERQAQSAR